MGHELYHCRACGLRLSERDLERGGGLRIFGQVTCVRCAPSLLGSIPPEELQAILAGARRKSSEADVVPHLSKDTPKARRETPPLVLRKGSPKPGTKLALLLGGVAALAAIVAIGMAIRSSPSETPPILSTRDKDGSSGAVSLEKPAFSRETSRIAQPVRQAEGPLPVEVESGKLPKLESETSGATGRTPVDLQTLEKAVMAAVNREEFSAAASLLEEANRSGSGAGFSSQLDRMGAEARERAESLFSNLKDTAFFAKRRGDEADVEAIARRVRAWGLSRYIQELDAVLASAKPEPAPAPSPETPVAADEKKDKAPPEPKEPEPAPVLPPGKGARSERPKVDQLKVDEAIRRGIEYLKGAGSPAAYSPGVPYYVPDSDELILLTFIHAGVSVRDPVFVELFKRVMEAPLAKTYKVSLQAMVLEELNRVQYQPRIWACAQFLVDNQIRTGQWGYGSPTPALKGVPTTGQRDGVPTQGGTLRKSSTTSGDSVREKPKVTRKLKVQQTRFSEEGGDDSNAQYAALGLRACHEAGIVIPESTIKLAVKWWETAAIDQQVKLVPNGVASGGGAGLKGWGYRLSCDDPCTQPYASMTAGAVGALVIYDYMLRKNWKADPLVQSGMGWLGKNFSVTQNSGARAHGSEGNPNAWVYYYLYALERAGILYGASSIGGHDWYQEGAEVLLAAQGANGAWSTGAPTKPVWDTCFAILFLKRATRPLDDVASLDRK